jgi:hypothetical protein
MQNTGNQIKESKIKRDKLRVYSADSVVSPLINLNLNESSAQHVMTDSVTPENIQSNVADSDLVPLQALSNLESSNDDEKSPEETMQNSSSGNFNDEDEDEDEDNTFDSGSQELDENGFPKGIVMSSNLMEALGLDAPATVTDWKPPEFSGLENSDPLISNNLPNITVASAESLDANDQ